MITFEDFKKIELKTAKIIAVRDHPDADRLYLVDVQLKDETRQVVAGIKGRYEPQDLIGKNVVVVSNLQPATIRGAESQGMILAASDGDDLCLVTLDRDMPIGSSVR